MPIYGAGTDLRFGYKGRGGPGQGLLPEEARLDEPDPDPGDKADERGEERDQEDPADVPVRPERHQPGCVAVVRCHIPVRPEAPAAGEVHEQAAERRQDAPHPQVAGARRERLTVVPGAGETGEPVICLLYTSPSPRD